MNTASLAPGDAVATAIPVAPNVLIIVGLAIIIVLCTVATFTKDIRIARRIYWAAWLLGIPVMALSVLGRGWKVFGLSLGVGLFGAVVYAYFRTSYLNIGGRVYAFTIALSRPDPPADGSPAPPNDAYGQQVAASNMWWVLAAFSAAAGFAGVVEGTSPLTIGVTGFVAAVSALVGYLDSHEGWPISRKQYVQLGFIVVASIPVFLLPPLAYVLTYWAGGGRHTSHRDDESLDA